MGFYSINDKMAKLVIKSICPSILLSKTSLKVITQKLWPKWQSYGQCHFGAPALRMIITWPFFIQFWQTNTLKWRARRDESNQTKKLSSIFLLEILVFGSLFCSKTSHGQCCTYPQIVGTCPGHFISQNCVLTKFRGDPTKVMNIFG